MDGYRLIANSFQELIELISVSVDAVAEPLQRGARACSDALLSEGKILCCGNGPGATVAQLFSTALLHRFERERPALPATCLNADGATLSALATGEDSREIHARQVRALGRAGDVLFVVAGGTGDDSLLQAIGAARDRGMVSVVLSGGAENHISGRLHPEDIEICVPGGSAPRLIEMQTVIAHCLCQLIDQTLFGGDDP